MSLFSKCCPLTNRRKPSTNKRFSSSALGDACDHLARNETFKKKTKQKDEINRLKLTFQADRHEHCFGARWQATTQPIGQTRSNTNLNLNSLIIWIGVWNNMVRKPIIRTKPHRTASHRIVPYRNVPYGIVPHWSRPSNVKFAWPDGWFQTDIHFTPWTSLDFSLPQFECDYCPKSYAQHHAGRLSACIVPIDLPPRLIVCSFLFFFQNS